MVSAIDPTKPADGVPAVKAELRANLLAAKLEIETLQATKIGHGELIDMQHQPLIRPELRAYSETSRTPKIMGEALTLDLQTGNVFEVTMTENVLSLVLANPPGGGIAGSCVLIVKQDANGGRTLAWPGSIRWPGGVQPSITAAKNAIDLFAFVTRDGGVTWYGFVGGQDFR
jgi:hypothetical protein